MKVNISDELRNKMHAYNWDLDDTLEVVRQEYLFQYGNYDDITVTQVTDEYVEFTFCNTFAKDIILQINTQGRIKEV